ncbi:ABC transporter ATP-binding protein [Streptosporangium sp. NPDC006013]|uniref:ABC transporter ATP-binding protein n=1 Tax=Streptosporangium sp. NPDC006013 TaxID=3155596 RepID=UPI0033BAE650
MELTVDNVSKSYPAAKGDTRLALAETSVTIAQGEFICVVGPSGCGKSTMLMIMAGLLAPTGGQVRLDGTLVTGPPAGLSVVFQDYGRSLFPWMNVRRNLAIAGKAAGLSRAETAERVREALAAVGLDGVENLYPWQMSGGMQQRTAIARALVVRPEVMLMDEPFAAVDAQTRADLEDLVLRVRHEYQMTVVFVTHDIDEAVYLGDRVLVMRANPGHLVSDVRVDLPRPRDQVSTKLDPRFAQLRSEIFRQVMRSVETTAPPLAPTFP